MLGPEQAAQKPLSPTGAEKHIFCGRRRFGPEQLVARLPSSWGDEWEGALDCALPARLLDEGFEAACVSE